MKNIATLFISCISALLVVSCQSTEDKAVDESLGLMEEYCEILESIKDEKSAKEAFTKMDGLADKYKAFAEKYKDKLSSKAADVEDQKKLAEKMKPLTDRMGKAIMAANTLLATKPALMKEFQNKSQKVAAAMTGMDS